MDDEPTDEEIEAMPPHIKALWEIYCDAGNLDWVMFQFDVYEWVKEYGKLILERGDAN